MSNEHNIKIYLEILFEYCEYLIANNIQDKL
jgi:hypothetical protein